MIKFVTAGESHGPALVAIIEGIPSGLSLTSSEINLELKRRMVSFGRGKRMQIEEDEVKILSGVRYGKTLGSPIALLIENKDFANWKEVMSCEKVSKETPPVTTPRPGHADLSGLLKFQEKDVRNIIERSSARETAARVAVGAICKSLLRELGVKILSQVVQIGKVKARKITPTLDDEKKIDSSPVRCLDEVASKKMVEEIKKAREKKDTVGGVFEVFAYGLLPGLGSYTSWDKRLDGRIAAAFMSIPAVKGVEIGLGFNLAKEYGSEVHDEIFFDKNKGFYRRTNRAGGIEGGVTNGETVVVRVAVKPVPTLTKPLKSVDIITKEPVPALKERADICVVPAASVIGEAMLAIVLAGAIKEKFGGDSLSELKANWSNYLEAIKNI